MKGNIICISLQIPMFWVKKFAKKFKFNATITHNIIENIEERIIEFLRLFLTSSKRLAPNKWPETILHDLDKPWLGILIKPRNLHKRLKATTIGCAINPRSKTIINPCSATTKLSKIIGRDLVKTSLKISEFLHHHLLQKSSYLQLLCHIHKYRSLEMFFS